MNRILIFGGTSEGRKLLEYYKKLPIEIHICVATDYGESLLDKESINIFVGRMTEYDMIEQMTKFKYDAVIDATHPYAVLVSENIKNACLKSHMNYYRLIRDNEKADNTVNVSSIEEAILYLQKTTGNILVTTGSKELKKFMDLDDFKNRVYARVLPSSTVIEECNSYGIDGSHIIGMQGPFSKEMNLALLLQINAKFLVTKQSGNAGGFLEKIEAAEKAFVKTIVIDRKKEDAGLYLSEMICFLNEIFQIPQKRSVTFVGIGMGIKSLTEEGRESLEKADLIIGGKRMIDSTMNFGTMSYGVNYKKPVFISYKEKEIKEYLNNHKEYKNIVIAVSGDVGFYSMANNIFLDEEKYIVKRVAGISSLCYFCAKIRISWEDISINSLHGKELNVIPFVLKNKKNFFLLGKSIDVSEICKSLCDNGLGSANIYIGERLSYDDEKISVGIAEDFLETKTKSLSVLLIENENVKSSKQSFGISDSKFIRGKVPMTKREVRIISIANLDIKEDEIIYDIGAGTGSVSIEASFLCPFGTVFAIENSLDAINLLKENRKKFNVSNIKIIEGTAPKSLYDLPMPSKVFIGGSKGNLEDIIEIVQKKNPSVKIVVNAITLETLAKTLEVFKKHGFIEQEYLSLSVSKSKEVGNYHMMVGENPIFIISARGGGVI